jgi:hypothetical protein
LTTPNDQSEQVPIAASVRVLEKVDLDEQMTASLYQRSDTASLDQQRRSPCLSEIDGSIGALRATASRCAAHELMPRLSDDQVRLHADD